MDISSKFQMLRLLEENAKYSHQDLADQLGVPVAEVAEEIANYEAKGIIGGYHAMVNWDKTDDDKVSAMIEIRVTPQRGAGYDRIAEKMYQYPEVESLYLMSGNFDFLVITRKATMKEISRFVNTLSIIEEVITTSTFIVLNRYKDHGTIFVDKPDQQERLVISQ